MTLITILNFIRFKILYISTTYIRWENKWLGNEAETPFAHLVGMVDNEIRNYAYHYGSKEYTGNGALVDLGSWLGSSVIPLAEGLQQNEIGKEAKIHTYDAFIWYENMNHSISYYNITNSYAVGQSFRKEFDIQTAAYHNSIMVHQGDLALALWSAEPIAYMMIDAMKDWELAKHIAFTFYPHLIPNTAIIIHEDFCHHYTSWIHLMHYRLRDYFQPLRVLGNSSGVAFRCIKPIDNIRAIVPEDYIDFSAEEIELAFDYSLGLVSDANKASVLSAKVMAYRHRDDYATAKNILREVPLLVRWLNFEMSEAAANIKRDGPKR